MRQLVSISILCFLIFTLVSCGTGKNSDTIAAQPCQSNLYTALANPFQHFHSMELQRTKEALLKLSSADLTVPTEVSYCLGRLDALLDGDLRYVTFHTYSQQRALESKEAVILSEASAAALDDFLDAKDTYLQHLRNLLANPEALQIEELQSKTAELADMFQDLNITVTKMDTEAESTYSEQLNQATQFMMEAGKEDTP